MNTQSVTHHKSYHAHHDPGAARLAVELAEQRHIAEVKSARRLHELAFTSGRVLMALVFITTAAIKAASWHEVVASLDAREMAAPAFLADLAIGLELVGGSLLLVGLFTRRAALTLVCWLVTVTLFMHLNVADDLNRSLALANLAIVAGLLSFAAWGGGTYSLDAVRTRRALEAERA